MAFMIYCLDKPNNVETRLANRPAHVEHLTKHESDLISAGPLLTDDGQTMIGSLLVVDFAERSEVDAFLAADPYTKAGLFQSVTVKPYRNVFPRTAK
ncbi:YciI family protein [Dongia sp.]|uniref:YciI family protein n=1 Tax=Dongia sp. TaxID=1977262 RepID=UPI0035B0AD59